MVDTQALKGVIVKNGLTQAKVAEEIGISSRTFTSRMKSGVFGSDEIERMIILLRIDNSEIPNIFFKK